MCVYIYITIIANNTASTAPDVREFVFESNQNSPKMWASPEPWGTRAKMSIANSELDIKITQVPDSPRQSHDISRQVYVLHAPSLDSPS